MNYQSNFFVVRTPLLTYQDGIKILENANNPHELLTSFFKDSMLQESIFLASPDLYNQLLKYLKGELKEKKKILSLEESLIEYLLRMSFRCTPFGLFAGITVGKFGFENKIDLVAKSEDGAFRRQIRLDTNILSTLARYFEEKPDFRTKTIYFVNSSLYKLGDKLRYIEYLIYKEKRVYDLTEIDYVPILGKITKKAKYGILFNEILEILLSDGFEYDDSINYIHQIIDAQVLVSEIEPSVIGDDFFNILTNKIQEYGLEHSESLLYSKKIIDEFDNNSPGVSTYQQVKETLLKFNFPEKNKGLFQVDLSKNANVSTLSEKLNQQIFEAAKVLMSLNKIDLGLSSLEIFKKAFYERYELKAVRLVDALDIETGINYKKLSQFSNSHKSIANESINAIKKFKNYKFNEFLKRNLSEIEITKEELLKFKIDTEKNSLPVSFSVLAKILNSDGNNIQLESLTGPSFTKLLGRFCNSNEALKREVQQMISEEKKQISNETIAEIIHLPESRTGNVLNRPHLSEYEIPYLGKSRLPIQQQIPVSDLYLKMDKGRLILFSKRMRKEITPRLSSAHNFLGKSLPIYQFLCEMQMQDQQGGTSWLWGELESEPFLPRIRYKNTILSSARWSVKLIDVVDGEEDIKDVAKFIAKLRLHFEEIQIPKYIYYCNLDNKLLLDSSSSFSVNYLAKKIKRDKVLLLKEVNFDAENLIVKSSDGGYANEFIIPYIQNNITTSNIGFVKTKISTKLSRVFEPGTKWVYYKVYLGVKTSNLFLSDVVLPLVKKLIKSKVIQSWFFIRYADPKPHLRIRFLLTNENNIGHLLLEFGKVVKYYIKNSLISNIQIETYVREIERYGESTMEICENYFFQNSMLILSIFNKNNWHDFKLKYQIAFRTINRILILLYPSSEERLRLIKIGVESNGLGKFGNKSRLQKKYHLEYRTFEKENVSFEIRYQNDASFKKAFKIHDAFLMNEFAVIRWDYKNDLNKILLSLIHMFVNRLFDQNQNDIEGELFFYLEKYYLSILAKEKKGLIDVVIE